MDLDLRAATAVLRRRALDAGLRGPPDRWIRLGRSFEAMDPLRWLARLSDHILDPGP